MNPALDTWSNCVPSQIICNFKVFGDNALDYSNCIKFLCNTGASVHIMNDNLFKVVNEVIINTTAVVDNVNSSVYLAIILKEVGPILLDARTPTKCLKSVTHLSTTLR